VLGHEAATCLRPHGTSSAPGLSRFPVRAVRPTYYQDPAGRTRAAGPTSGRRGKPTSSGPSSAPPCSKSPGPSSPGGWPPSPPPTRSSNALDALDAAPPRPSPSAGPPLHLPAGGRGAVVVALGLGRAGPDGAPMPPTARRDRRHCAPTIDRRELIPAAADGALAGVISFSSPCCLPLIPGYSPTCQGSRLRSRPPGTRAGTLRARCSSSPASLRLHALASPSPSSASAAPKRPHHRPRAAWCHPHGSGHDGGPADPFLPRAARRPHPDPVGPKPPSPSHGVRLRWAPCIGPVLATILAQPPRHPDRGWGRRAPHLYSSGSDSLHRPSPRLPACQGSLEWLKRHGRSIEIAGGAMPSASACIFVTAPATVLHSAPALLRPLRLAPHLSRSLLSTRPSDASVSFSPGAQAGRKM